MTRLEMAKQCFLQVQCEVRRAAEPRYLRDLVEVVGIMIDVLEEKKTPADYEVEIFSMYRSPQTRVEIVRAYTAVDADFQARQRWGDVNSRKMDAWYVRIIGPADAPSAGCEEEKGKK
jgi:hypothetical protein